MNIRRVVSLCSLVLAMGWSAAAVPPKVVKTIPENNAVDVDPNLGELRVIFDQAMSPGNMSIVGSGIKYPKFAGRDQCRWEDEKTLVYSWKLEPNHEYSFSINSKTFKNFKSETGESAEPYPISFKTASGSSGGGKANSRRRGAAAADTTETSAKAEGQPSESAVEAKAPKVVSATPDNHASDVDPNLGELRVVFDQPMDTGGMSIVGGGATLPKMNGTPKWENDRTIVAKWKLEPNHKYWLSINNEQFRNFTGTNGVNAEPYPIEFRTGGGTAAEAAPTTTEASDSGAKSKEAFAALQKAINENYSYRDLRKVNWSNVFKQYGPKLEACDKNWKFAQEAAWMLSAAQDLHLWLKLDDEIIPTYRRNAEWNVASSLLPQQVPGWTKRSSIIATGRFEDGIRYLFIQSFPGGGDAELEPAFDVLKECTLANKPLIIDVRANGGGAEPLAAKLAGCFVNQPVAYAKDRIHKNGQVSGPFERVLKPNKDHEFFNNSVVVLAGPGTVSSAESFVMMMKQAKKCTFIGASTAGSSGNPQPVELGNGVTLFVPSWEDLRLDDTCLEGEGFAPDIEVKTTAKSFGKKDPVIEAALKFLREE